MVTKKIRFEVFKRDGFRCGYCGKSPPSVTLEIDHIHPKSKKGKDDINNLITSCFDCNRGKRDIPLNRLPNTLSENLSVLQEQEEQLKAYRRFVDKIQKRVNKDIREIASIFTDHFRHKDLSEQFKNGSLKNFLGLLPKHEVEIAMNLAVSKKGNKADDAIRYFCGICWNKIKKRSAPWE